MNVVVFFYKYNQSWTSLPSIVLSRIRYPVCDASSFERTVLYKTKSLDGTKPNTNPKTNPNTNPIQLFCAFYEHRPLIFSLALCCDTGPFTCRTFYF